MPRSTLKVRTADPERYEKHFEQERSRLVNWQLLHSKMKELNLNNSEQMLIRNDFLKQEAQNYREKYGRIY